MPAENEVNSTRIIRRCVETETGDVENRSFAFEPNHPRRKSVAELRSETEAELKRRWSEDVSTDSSSDSDEGAPVPVRQARRPSQDDGPPVPPSLVCDSAASGLAESMHQSPANDESCHSAAPSPPRAATRWYRDTTRERGWSPGTMLMEARPHGATSIHEVLERQGRRLSPSRGRSPMPNSPAEEPRGAVVSPAVNPLKLTSHNRTGPVTQLLVRRQLARPPSAVHVASPDLRCTHVSRVSDLRTASHRQGFGSPTAARVGNSCVRCAAKSHAQAHRQHALVLSELEARAQPGGLAPRARPGSELAKSSSGRPLPVSLRSIRKAQSAQAEIPEPRCQHHIQLTGSCPSCDETRRQVAAFECVAMELAAAREGEKTQLAKPMGAASSDDDEDDKLVNAPDAAARAAARREPEVNALLSPLRERIRRAQKASELAALAEEAQGGRKEAVRVTLPSVTVADLYRGTTHRDRENLYISVMGGLSFDLTRDKFRTMIMRVLAPRLGVAVTDEQILNLFSQFDINNGGTVSFFEYLTALCEHIMSSGQRAFVDGLYTRLRAAAATASREVMSRGMRGAKKPASTGPRLDLHRGRSTEPVDPGEVSVVAERLPYFVTGLRGSGEAATLSEEEGMAPGLSSADMDLSHVQKATFDLLNKSLLFPHPEEEALALLIHACFADLSPVDRVEQPKFVLLLFCDDAVMGSLGKHVP